VFAMAFQILLVVVWIDIQWIEYVLGSQDHFEGSA
jgi:hypothetical protein